MRQDNVTNSPAFQTHKEHNPMYSICVIYLFSIYEIANIQQTPYNSKLKKLKTLFAIRKYYFLSLKKTTIFLVTDGILTL